MKILKILLFSSLSLSATVKAHEGCATDDNRHEVYQRILNSESNEKMLVPITLDHSVRLDTDIVFSTKIAENCKTLAKIPANVKDREKKVETCMPFNPTQKARIAKAEELLRLIVKSSIFKDKIVNYKWSGFKKIPKLDSNGNQIFIDGKKQWKKVRISGDRFVDNNGLTDEEIYYKILKAAEVRPKKTPIDEVLNLELLLYRLDKYPQTKVRGYTNGGVKWVKVNEKYLNKNELIEIAENLIHEWLHKLGFGHDQDATPTRPFSVPYGVGQILVESYKAMKDQGLIKGI